MQPAADPARQYLAKRGLSSEAASLIVGDQHAGINKRLAVFLIAAKTF
jgi:hypothetical protein